LTYLDFKKLSTTKMSEKPGTPHCFLFFFAMNRYKSAKIKKLVYLLATLYVLVNINQKTRGRGGGGTHPRL
jgi:hypothetical protein